MNENFLALADFAGKDEAAVRHDLASDFEADIGDIELIVAYMSVGSWGCDSSAFIVFRKDGELYEVNGSHCSCYGFEGQWTPEPIPDITAVALRSDWCLAGGGYDGDNEGNAAAIRAHLSRLEST